VGTVTVRFSGMRPAVLARAAAEGITEGQAWAQREAESLTLLLDAADDLETRTRAVLASAGEDLDAAVAGLASLTGGAA
jgi:hypothetical protein